MRQCLSFREVRSSGRSRTEANRAGATELTLGAGERRVLRLPILTQPDGQGNLETVAVIWTPGLTKDQNGDSRFEVH